MGVTVIMLILLIVLRVYSRLLDRYKFKEVNKGFTNMKKRFDPR